MSKNTKLKIIVILFIFLMCGLIYLKYDRDSKKSISTTSSVDIIFEKTNSGTFANVTKYVVYGTHFNLEED